VIAGIGIDMVLARRMDRWLETPGLPQRYFHPDELAEALSRGPGAALSLAARFAAKEAFGKALGTGLAGIALKDIMVVSNEKGRPCIRATGTARAALEASGAGRAHLSLSHEGDRAIAVAVLESPHEGAGQNQGGAQ